MTRRVALCVSVQVNLLNVNVTACFQAAEWILKGNATLAELETKIEAIRRSDADQRQYLRELISREGQVCRSLLSSDVHRRETFIQLCSSQQTHKELSEATMALNLVKARSSCLRAARSRSGIPLARL